MAKKAVEVQKEFFVEKGLEKIYVNETDYVEIIERPEEKRNKFAAVAVEASKKYPGKFNTNTFSACTLEEAVELANMNIRRIEYLMEEEASKTEEQKAQEAIEAEARKERTAVSSLNTGMGIK
jgi:hypothetical protein